jgi:SdrD B-like domain/PKD domain
MKTSILIFWTKKENPIFHCVSPHKIHFILFALLLLIFSHASAQVSGFIFKDFNANGTKDNTATFNEVGMAGGVVKATDPTGAALSVSYAGGGASTDATGGYSVSSGTTGQIRLEFIMPDNYTFASTGASGGTTIMFPVGATQNLAVNYPQDYCQASPQIVVPCYVGQDLTGPNATEAAMARFDYYGNDKYIGQAGYTMPTKITDHQQLGATYGVAYSRITKKVFVGAVLRRHASYGPQGIGGIYEVDPITGAVNNWLNIETLSGIDAGTDTRDATTLNTISPTKSYDYQAFFDIGKQSLGDVEISNDSKTLYVINLFQQSLVAIDVATKALVGSYPITASALGLACPQSDFRPWGLKYHKGKLYVGAVCTAQTSQLTADIKGYVLEFDPANTGAGFNTYFSFPLNYTRESNSTNSWHPWNEKSFDPGSNNPSPIDPTFNDDARNAQAILSDIEFDADGSLVLGLMDRHGMMFSSGNAPPDPAATSTASTSAFTNGDILRVCNTTTGFILECTLNFPYSGGGEFYDDKRQGGAGTSQVKETAGGALAFLAGSGEIASTAVDPFTVLENGIAWWNNTSGVRNRAYMIFDKNTPGNQGKTAGLGDIELLCDAAPIEIGNRVWSDTNNNGIQDAGESPLANISVVLCLASAPTTPVATATTDANGNYYFSSATGTNTTSAIYGLNIAFNTNYILKFPTTATGGLSLSTKPNQGANDLIDTDANATGKISFTTGYAGENNHSFDVGYALVTCTAPTTPIAYVSPTSIGVGGSISLTSSATGTDASTTYTWAGPSTFTSTLQNPTTTAPATAGGYTYSVTISNGGTCSVSATTSLTVTAAVVCTAITGAAITLNPISPVVAGTTVNLTASKTDAGTPTTYTWVASPNTGFTSTTSQATLTNPIAGTYNFTVTIQNNNGTGTCTATATSSLSVSTALTPCTVVTGAGITLSPVSPVVAGTTVNLTASKTDAGTPTTYTWVASPNTGFTSTTQNATLTNPIAGTYNFTVTIQNNNGTGTCTATATSSLSVSTLPQLLVQP